MIYNLSRKYTSQLKAVLKQSPYKSNSKITKKYILVTIKITTHIFNTPTQNRKNKRKTNPQNSLPARQKKN